MPGWGPVRVTISPGAYLTDGTRLYEVVEYENSRLVLEDCSNNTFRVEMFARVTAPPWQLVRGAPVVPDTAEAA